MQRTFILILILFCASGYIFSQQILILEKHDLTGNKKFNIGDIITIKTFEENNLIKSKILHLQDSTIYLENGYAIDFNMIDYIQIRNNAMRFFSRFFYAVSGVSAIVLINSAIKSIAFSLPATYVPVAVAGGSLVIATSLKLTEKQKFKIRSDKWRLKILDMDNIFLPESK